MLARQKAHSSPVAWVGHVGHRVVLPVRLVVEVSTGFGVLCINVISLNIFLFFYFVHFVTPMGIFPSGSEYLYMLHRQPINDLQNHCDNR